MLAEASPADVNWVMGTEFGRGAHTGTLARREQTGLRAREGRRQLMSPLGDAGIEGAAASNSINDRGS